MLLSGCIVRWIRPLELFSVDGGEIFSPLFFSRFYIKLALLRGLALLIIASFVFSPFFMMYLGPWAMLPWRSSNIFFCGLSRLKSLEIEHRTQRILSNSQNIIRLRVFCIIWCTSIEKHTKYWWAKLFLYFPGALHNWSQHWNSNRWLQEDFILFVPNLCHGQLIVATYTSKGSTVDGYKKVITYHYSCLLIRWIAAQSPWSHHWISVSVKLAFSSWL